MAKEKETDRIAVKWVPTTSLIPYARNARLHSPAQISKIGASIKEFGWTNPILTDGDNGVIAGHGRLAAAQLLNLEKVPTIELSHLSETQKRAYILADNRLALDATWDEEMLGLELQDLKAEEFDLGLTGFSEGEIDPVGDQSSPGASEGEEIDPVPPEGRYLVFIECESEKDQIDIITECESKGWKCRAQIA